MIAKNGADALYHGEIAEAITSQVSKHSNPGSLSLSDLSRYQAKERDPVCGDYKQWRVCGMPPPSSGGVAVVQTLGILEALRKRDATLDMANMLPVKSASAVGWEPVAGAVHLMAEASVSPMQTGHFTLQTQTTCL